VTGGGGAKLASPAAPVRAASAVEFPTPKKNNWKKALSSRGKKRDGVSDGARRAAEVGAKATFRARREGRAERSGFAPETPKCAKVRELFRAPIALGKTFPVVPGLLVTPSSRHGGGA